MVNLPSEKVPAPPSPNCTFESVFIFPSCLKSSTSFCLSSTAFPCSINIGLCPFLAKVYDANNPAGPAPITTGLSLKLFLKSTSIFAESTSVTSGNLEHTFLSLHSISIV